MGGGLELALGFDLPPRRHASEDGARLSGGEDRPLPRLGRHAALDALIGPSLAAEMICSGEPAKAERAKQLGLVFDVVPTEQLKAEALRLLGWAQSSGSWRRGRKQKQQPVGLSEEQASFTFAVIAAQVMAKTGGHYPAPLAALTAIAKGCNLPLEDGLKIETRAVRRRSSAVRSRATSSRCSS